MNNNTFFKPTDEFRDYKALEEIEKNPSISQRDLAQSLNVALGIANACIHTLIKKGLIKIRGDNNRSITYHLTKQGVLHKSRLALEWTKNTINYYREMRQKVIENLRALNKNGLDNVFLIGTEELVEVVQIIAAASNIAISGSFVLDRATGSDVESQEIIESYQNSRDLQAGCILLCGISCKQSEAVGQKLGLGVFDLFNFGLGND